MKPGYKTSEFWMAILGIAANAALTAHQAGPLTAGTLGWNALPGIAYILSRGWAKSGGADASTSN